MRTTTAAESRRSRLSRDPRGVVILFLLPAAVVLLAFVAYPIAYTFVRSAFDATGSRFVGLNNYLRIITQPRSLIALKNNAIWVLVAPVIVTAVGLVLAVLTERVRWATAFRLIMFIPLVVSGLAAGVTFRFVYAQDPRIGLANSVLQRAVHVFRPPGPYPGAIPSTEAWVQQPDGSYVSTSPFQPGDAVQIGMVRIRPDIVSDAAVPAVMPGTPEQDRIAGVAWLDFSRGGGGTRGAIDVGQLGLPMLQVQLLRDGQVEASTRAGPDGTFLFESIEPGRYTIRLPVTNFREPYPGLGWLGPSLIIASLIAAYIWIHTGFALIVIGAGLAGLNRDYLDLARVEGANEFQVLTRVTIPLLHHVLMVVLVTTIISVLKIFDLVIIVAPESVQADATVLALEMWRASFGGARDFGLGSALAVLLFVLIIPAMAFNIRRFRFDQ